jgi:hypothetical protein
MSRKVQIILALAVLLVPPAGLGIWYYLQPPPPESWFIENGYFELSPPAKRFGPGTIAQIERLPDGSLHLYEVCRTDHEALKHLWTNTPTVDRKTHKEAGDAIRASTQNKLGAAEIAGNLRRDIKVALANMKIISINHEDLLLIQQKALRRPACERAIVIALQAGAEVCQTVEVVQADVSYDATVDRNLQDEHGGSFAEIIGGELEVTSADESHTVVRGEGLYHGAKLYVQCFTLPDGRAHKAPGPQLVQLQ